MSKKTSKATKNTKATKTAKIAAAEAPATIPITEAPKAKKASANKQNATKAAKPKKVSALHAAAQVLTAKGEPMTAPELIAAMAEQKLWTSPGGKTPAATLYAAMLREITTKGKQSRFSRPERGKFVSTAK